MTFVARLDNIGLKPYKIMWRTKNICFLLLFVFLQIITLSFAQTTLRPINDLVKKLSSEDGPVLSGVMDVFNELNGKDSSTGINALNQLETRGSSKNSYFKSRFFLTKAFWLWNVKQPHPVEQVEQLMKQALNAAYETNNDSLISEIAWHFGSTMYYASKIEAAVMYTLYSAETDEKIGRNIPAERCAFLGDVLYVAHNYEKSIYYAREGIQKQNNRLRHTVM